MVSKSQENQEFREECCQILAENLGRIRKSAGWTQEEFASLLGISRQTISNIESGQSKIRWTLFLAMVFVLQANLNGKEALKSCGFPLDELREQYNKGIHIS